MSVNRFKIAVLGGSFNPPHIGHMQISNYCLDILNFDKIILVPSFDHPYGKTNADFDLRIKWLEIMFSKSLIDERLEISRIEEEMDGPGYTYLLLLKLKESLPENTELFFVVGDDLEDDVINWHEGKKLLDEFKFVFLPRSKESLFSSISSSQIRSFMKNEGTQTRALPYLGKELYENYLKNFKAEN